MSHYARHNPDEAPVHDAFEGASYRKAPNQMTTRSIKEIQADISKLGFPNRGSRKMLKQESLRHELKEARKRDKQAQPAERTQEDYKRLLNETEDTYTQVVGALCNCNDRLQHQRDELLSALTGLVNISTHPCATKSAIRKIANEARAAIARADHKRTKEKLQQAEHQLLAAAKLALTYCENTAMNRPAINPMASISAAIARVEGRQQ